jgi:hypothetical protein
VLVGGEEAVAGGAYGGQTAEEEAAYAPLPARAARPEGGGGAAVFGAGYGGAGIEKCSVEYSSSLRPHALVAQGLLHQ